MATITELETMVTNLTNEVARLRANSSSAIREAQGLREFALARVDLRLSRLENVTGGNFDVDQVETPDQEDPYWDEGSGIGFSGTVYVSGNRLTGKNSNASYPWVKVDVAAGTATELTGPPSDPFPPNEEWYEKAQVAGDIHVTRL